MPDNKYKMSHILANEVPLGERMKRRKVFGCYIVRCGQFIQPFIVASTDVIHTYICRYSKIML